MELIHSELINKLLPIVVGLLIALAIILSTMTLRLQVDTLRQILNAFKGIEAIIQSMTPKERSNPDLIDGSRRQRISKGSGREIQEVNKLMKQFDEMRKMMRMMGNKDQMKRMMGQMQNMPRPR